MSTAGNWPWPDCWQRQHLFAPIVGLSLAQGENRVVAVRFALEALFQAAPHPFATFGFDFQFNLSQGEWLATLRSLRGFVALTFTVSAKTCVSAVFASELSWRLRTAMPIVILASLEEIVITAVLREWWTNVLSL